MYSPRRVQENNTSTFGATVTAFMICGKEPGCVISKGKAAPIGIGATGGAQAACPATLVPMAAVGPQDKNGSLFTNINANLPAFGSWDVDIQQRRLEVAHTGFAST